MDAQRWRRLERLFAAATEMMPGERGPWLEAQCGDDPTLLRDVQVLLEADKRASDGHFIVDAIESAAQEFCRDSTQQKNPKKIEERRAKSEETHGSRKRGGDTL